jgi:hypothetical protein
MYVEPHNLNARQSRYRYPLRVCARYDLLCWLGAGQMYVCIILDSDISLEVLFADQVPAGCTEIRRRPQAGDSSWEASPAYESL